MRLRRRPLATALLVLVLAGCGGSDSDSASDAEPDEQAAVDAPVEGEVFADPQGAYVITVPSDWKPVTARDPEVEAWAVGPKRSGFTPNVNMLTVQEPGDTLQHYLDASIDQLAVLPGFETRDREVVAGAEGQELGVLHYSASPNEAPISFLGYIAVRSDGVVIATLTALPASFDQLRREVEPYLRTLKAT